MYKKILLILLLFLSSPVCILAETASFKSGIEEMLTQSNGFHLEYKFKEEIEILDKVIKLNPQDAEVYYKRCLAYYGLGRFDKAREDLYRAELEGKVIGLAFLKQLNELNEDFDRRIKSEGMKSSKSALAKAGLTSKDFDRITQHYYENPQPGKLMLIIRSLLSDGWSIYDISGFGPLSHFFATIAHNDPSFLADLENERGNFTGAQKDALDEIIYEAEKFRSRKPSSPQGLDYLWAEFFATGSEEPIQKIISVLRNQGADLQLTRYSAEWSLRANAKQDKRVRRIIKDMSVVSYGELKESLEKILK